MAFFFWKDVNKLFIIFLFQYLKKKNNFLFVIKQKLRAEIIRGALCSFLCVQSTDKGAI